jgi:hypothetical protein
MSNSYVVAAWIIFAAFIGILVNIVIPALRFRYFFGRSPWNASKKFVESKLNDVRSSASKSRYDDMLWLAKHFGKIPKRSRKYHELFMKPSAV